MSLLLTLGLGGTATPTPSTGGNTPYMNLLLPTVSVTLGPLYATEVNQAFLRVDQHDHSDGFGHRVGTNGLNINAPLTFNGNGATNVDSVGFNIRTPAHGLTGMIYMSGDDLFVVDGTGAVIQLTAAHNVNIGALTGNWVGLSAPAQASYNGVTTTFALQSNTVGPKYGLLATGDIQLYPKDPSTSGIYTQLAAGGSTTYTFVFPPAVPAGGGTKQQLISLKGDGTTTLGPTLPASGICFMRMDSNGVPYADVIPDNSGSPTLQLVAGSPNVLRVTPGGITNTQIANGTVLPRNMATANIGSSGAVTTFTLSTTDVVAGAAGIVASGQRPLMVTFKSTGRGFVYNDSVVGAGQGGVVSVYIDGVLQTTFTFYAMFASTDVAAPAASANVLIPTVAAGLRSVDFRIRCLSGTGGSLAVDAVTMTVMEI